MATLVTIEQLAQRLGGNLWSKGEIKRIYLDRGHNTKKMTTKTYVYERQDGTFGVSCYIDCPSQHPSWIESQKQEVVEGVEAEIEEALANTYYLVVDDATNEYIDVDGKPQPLNYIYTSDRLLSQDAAEKFISKELGKGYSVKAFDRDEFTKQVAELDAIEAEKRASQPITTNVAPIVSKPALEVNTDTPDYGVDTKVKHFKFGEGTVIAESDKILDVNFPSVGDKKLLKAFVKLEKL